MKRHKLKKLGALDPTRKKGPQPAKQDAEPVRLQKLLANNGVGSRREVDALIEAGQVKVNGRVATLGQKATTGDRITVKGKPVRFSKLPFKTRVIAYNKPVGQVTSRKPERGQKSVFDNLPTLRNGRWISIGRLDINTQGLLLFTNDGELANQLMHPSHEVEREYAVRVNGTVTDQMLRELKEGVQLDDGMSHFDRIIKRPSGDGRNQWFHVILHRGKYREVRRMWETFQDIQVSRLIRVRYGNIILPRWLNRGDWSDLSEKDLTALRSQLKTNIDPSTTE